MNYNFESSERIEDILSKSKDQDKAIKAIERADQMAKDTGLKITGSKWEALANHVVAMVDRSITGDKLFGMDSQAFSAVSNRAMKMAEDLVEFIGNIEEDEKYLMSVHFQASMER